MRSLVIAAAIGAVAGAAAVDAALRVSSVPEPVTADVTREPMPRARQRSAATDETGSFDTEIRLYTWLREAEPPVLVTDFDTLAESAASSARDQQLAATLAALAERDANSALEVLTRHAFGRRAAHALALAFLDGAGISYENAMAVAAILPALDRVRFAAESAAVLAIESPDDALVFARTFEVKLERMRAVTAVADVIAERDPYAAMRIAESIPLEPGVLFRPDRRVFQMAALGHLARASFVSAADFVAREIRAVPSMAMRGDFLEVLRFEAQHVDPLLALEGARLLDADGARPIESTAIERLARDNPLDALAYVDDIPGFAQRARLRQEVARIYGQRDPEAALAWVSSQGEATARLMINVFEGVARRDPLRALDVVLTTDRANDGVYVVNAFGGMRAGGDQFDVMERALNPDSELPPGVSRDELIVQIGDRLLEIPDPEMRRRWIDRYVMSTSRYDPAAALTFAAENPERVGRWIYSNLVRQFRSDPLAAMEHIDLVPEEMRPLWVGSVASTLAERNPAAALDWIEQYRGQEQFTELASNVAASVVKADSLAALDLLASLPLAQQIETSRRIAHEWAEADPIAARAWVETLPPGQQRDAGLSGLLSPGWRRLMGSAATPALDATLLGLFSSDSARQEAVAQVAEMFAQRQPSAAQALLDEHVTDPALRLRVEMRIADRARFR